VLLQGPGRGLPWGVAGGCRAVRGAHHHPPVRLALKGTPRNWQGQGARWLQAGALQLQLQEAVRRPALPACVHMPQQCGVNINIHFKEAAPHVHMPVPPNKHTAWLGCMSPSRAQVPWRCWWRPPPPPPLTCPCGRAGLLWGTHPRP
jgi:hypothetical protein